MCTGVLNGVVIKLLDMVYRWLAIKLVEYENHRTQKQFMDMLITKLFLFSFVNNYTALVYITFVKTLDPEIHPFNTKDACEDNDCYAELQSQLVGIMIGKGVLDNLFNWLVPKAQNIKNAYSRNLHKETDFETEGGCLTSISEVRNHLAQSAEKPWDPLFQVIHT